MPSSRTSVPGVASCAVANVERLSAEVEVVCSTGSARVGLRSRCRARERWCTADVYPCRNRANVADVMQRGLQGKNGVAWIEIGGSTGLTPLQQTRYRQLAPGFAGSDGAPRGTVASS